MVSGTWDETSEKVRAGFFMRFVAAALARIQAGPRGIVAIPVKANWRPKKEVVEITKLQDLIDTYGEETTGDFTAYQSILLTLLGRPLKILGYRLVDGNEAKASITLKDGAAADVLTLTTKYETERSFKVTVRDNPVDSVNKKDIILLEGTTQLYTFTFDKGASIVDNAVAAINDDANNVWIDAAKVAGGDGTLADVTDQSLTGGNAGAAAVTNSDYTDAMTAFEAQTFNAFTLDGATDSSLQTSVETWVDRLRDEGKKVVAYLGGSAADDQDITNANSRSTGFDFEGVVNLGTGGKLDGETYSSAQVACYIAGLASGQSLKESLTYAITVFDDVVPRLTNEEIKSATKAGTLVMFHDGEKVIIERGINTLTSLGQDQNRAWQKIKGIRVMDAIAEDTSKAASTSYIGKVPNNEDGQQALLGAIKNYFETLTPSIIADDFTVEVDEELQATAEGDQFFWKYDAKLIDNMEQIFGTGNIRYGG